jgi:hypothetical protein
MTMGFVAMMIGLIIVPGTLLWGAGRLRHASVPARRAFWGAVAGHCVAGVAAVTAGVMLPEEWTAADRMRGFLGLWSLLVLPVLGAAAGYLLSPTRR